MTTPPPLVETRTQGRVGLICLNRTEALNALNLELAEAIVEAATGFDADKAIGCIVLTGNGRAFAAGADIAEMQSMDYEIIKGKNWFAQPWDRFCAIKTPLIAAVNGFALGGGCELALMCDMIVASSKARFGQPEITLGVIPGMGGSQRLARFIGKPMTMDLCLSGRMIDAEEALRIGLASRVIAHESFREEVLVMAEAIAQKSRVALRMLTDMIDAAFEQPLAEGLIRERNTFYECFKNEDQKEGMRAFVEKRPADWRHE